MLKPIAIAIDHLQGQSSCPYGELIPTLFAVQAKLHDMQALNLRYCSHILQAIITGFEKMFSSFLQLKSDGNEAILATATHPFFKMRWLPLILSSEKKWIHHLILHSAEELGILSESDTASPLKRMRMASLSSLTRIRLKCFHLRMSVAHTEVNYI